MSIASELRAALKRLSIARLFASLCIAVQAFGIGVTTSVATTFDALFGQHQIRDISRVVDVQRVRPGEMLSFSDFVYLREHQTVFTELLPWARSWAVLAMSGRHAELIPIETVGGNYFAFVGAAVQLGRPLVPSDDGKGSAAVAVISDATWRRSFGADSGVIGRTVMLDGRPVEIVGVAPSSFRGIALPNVSATTMWISVATARSLRPEMDLTDADLGMLHLKGRLKEHMSIQQAEAEVRLLARQMDEVLPPKTGTHSESYQVKRTFRVRPSSAVRMSERGDQIGLPLAHVAFAATGSVFLIVCINLAVLCLARAHSRKHEAAIRVAFGASPTNLLIGWVVEGTLLSLAGALVGAAVALILVNRIATAGRQWPGFSPDFIITLGSTFYGVLFATVAACFIVIVSAPALAFRALPIAQTLSMKASIGGVHRRWLQQTLIVCQVALSFTLLSAAVLCARQVILAASHDSGMDLDRLAVLQLNFRYQRVPPQRGRAILERILSGIKGLPEVENACLSSSLPVGTTIHSVGQVTAADRPFVPGLYSGERSIQLISTPEIFGTFGIDLLRGRFLRSTDREGGEPVAVISRLAAERLFGTLDAVGRTVLLRPQAWVGEPEADIQTVTVAGVVSDTDTSQVGRRREPVVYLPFSQHHDEMMAIVARAPEPRKVLEAMRAVVSKVDPDVAIFVSGTGSQVADNEQLLLRGTARVAAVLGAAGLLLAMSGLMSALWTMITRQHHEIAVKMALGATPRIVTWDVLRTGLFPVLVGIVVGLLLSVPVNMTLRAQFIRFLPALDPVVFAVVPILTVVVALATCYVPARYASRANPQSSLKEV